MYALREDRIRVKFGFRNVTERENLCRFGADRMIILSEC